MSKKKNIKSTNNNNNINTLKSIEAIDITTEDIAAHTEAEAANENKVDTNDEAPNKLDSNEEADNMLDSNEEAPNKLDPKKNKRKKLFLRGLRILFTIGFFVFSWLFINEVFIQPYKFKKTIERARDLYHSEATKPTAIPDDIGIESDDRSSDSDNDSSKGLTPTPPPTPTPDPNRDEMGRLKKFGKLLEVNEDVKGWIRLDNINGENDTKIDYVVVQSSTDDPEYYLSRDWASHEYLKAGSLFLDANSSLEKSSKNLIIHGHNMTSSDDMFHYLLKYNDLDFLIEHPIISFDTIYEEALWKVFAIYITPGNNDRDDFFQYIKPDFPTHKDFMEYIYQIRIRSLFYTDDIDIKETDQILTLSTCSYELKNYRTIVVARKVRPGEDPIVNTDNFEKKDPKDVLYPPSYYWRYGGKAPKLPSFDEALENDLIPWYNPIRKRIIPD